MSGSQSLVILTLRHFGGLGKINDIANTCNLSRATVKTGLRILERTGLVILTKGFETYALSNKGRKFLGMPEDIYVEDFASEENPGYVYFIDNGENIKIGYSVDPYQRLEKLQNATDKQLNLIAVFPGSKKDEREIHHKFINNQIRGEWYKRDQDLDDLIEKHTLDAEKNFFSRNSNNKESILINTVKDNTINIKNSFALDFLKQNGVWENQRDQIASFVDYDLDILKEQFNGDDLPLVLWRIKNSVPPPEPIKQKTFGEKYGVCDECYSLPCDCEDTNE